MGGKIVKIAKGNYTEKARNINYYSGGDINTIAGKRINEKAGEGIFFGDAEEAPQSNLSRTPPITIECYVEFRPKPDWRGEFGFDWFRNGDYKDSAGLFNNLDYKDIISKQYTDSRHRTLETNPNNFKGYFKKNIALYNSLKNKFKPTKIKWKHKKDSSGNILNDASGNPVMDEFLASYLSIFKKETDPDVSVTIQAYIHVKTEPEELKIKLEESQKEFFSVTPVDLTKTVTSGTPTKQDITITCKKTCSTDQVINIVAVTKGLSPHFCGDPEHEAENQITKEEVVGKLIIKANDKAHRKTKKIVFVQLKTKLSRGLPNTGNATSINTDIKKYLRQALIDVHQDSTAEILDLTTYTPFNSRYVKNGQIESKTSLMGSLEYLFIDMLKKRNPSEEHKYDGFFMVFIFDEKGYHSDPNQNKAGFAFPGKNYTILFRDANSQTGAHEILHALNLEHTFSNTNSYTFKYMSNSNLLSYAHHKALTNAAYKTARYSLQHWQWAIANAAADPE